MAGAHRVQESIGAGVVPFVPGIERRRRVGGDLRARGALDDHLLARRDEDGLPAGGGDGGPAGSAGDERSALAGDLHAVVPLLLDGERRVRGVHLYRAPRLEPAKVEGDGTRGHLELEKIRLLVRQADLGVRSRAHERVSADLKLQGARGRGIQLVTRGERSVDLRLRPVLGAGAPERDLALRKAQARRCLVDRGLPWVLRVSPVRGRRRAGQEAERQGEPDDPRGTHLESSLVW